MDDNPLGNQQVPDAAKFAIGAQPQGTPPPVQAVTPPPSPSSAEAMTQQLKSADNEHHSQLGKAFRSIMGNEVSYQIDPQTGKMVQTEIPQKPSQLWRSILAGVITGGAAAARDKATNFVSGAAEGAGAVIDKREQQDKDKRGQAEQDFKNQLTARSSNTEEDMKRAQIAFHNAQTLHENKIMQQQDYVFHKEVSDSGKKQLQPFIDADPTLMKFQDIPETKMNDMLKGNPDSAHLLWEPTGTRITIGADGKPNVEATYSAVDPKGNVKITDDQIKQWKDAGLDQIYGKATWDVLKKDKELPANTYMAINQKSQELTNKQLITKKAKFDEEKETAQIGLMKAQSSHFKAEAAKLYADEGDKKAALEAFDILSSGKDVSKLSIKGREALSKGLTDIIKTNMGAIKDLPKDATGQLDKEQQGKAGELYETAEKYQKILDRVYGIKPVEKPAATEGGKPPEAVQNISEMMHQDKIPANSLDAFEYINKTNLSAGDKASAIKQYAVVPWSTVTQRAQQEGVTRDKMAAKLKNQGFKLQFESDADVKEAEGKDLSITGVGATN